MRPQDTSLQSVMAQAQAAMEGIISSNAASAEREAMLRMYYFRLDYFYEVRGREIQQAIACRNTHSSEGGN